MNAKVGLSDLAVECIIGVNPDERLHPQTIFVDLAVDVDISACVQSDDLTHAIDYTLLAALCVEVAQQGCYKLLETYCFDVARCLFRKFSACTVQIKVKKKRTSVNGFSFFVELFLTKEQYLQLC